MVTRGARLSASSVALVLTAVLLFAATSKGEAQGDSRQRPTGNVVDIVLDTEQGASYGAVGPINPSFAGFSVEWSIATLFMPSAQGGHYDITLQLFRNLLEATGSAPTLRIGGNSADQAWYTRRALPPPPPPRGEEAQPKRLTHNWCGGLVARGWWWWLWS
jgi:hypothetical protein